MILILTHLATRVCSAKIPPRAIKDKKAWEKEKDDHNNNNKIFELSYDTLRNSLSWQWLYCKLVLCLHSQDIPFVCLYGFTPTTTTHPEQYSTGLGMSIQLLFLLLLGDKGVVCIYFSADVAYCEEGCCGWCGVAVVVVVVVVGSWSCESSSTDEEAECRRWLRGFWACDKDTRNPTASI